MRDGKGRFAPGNQLATQKHPPPDAAEQVRALAADGWSVVGIAAKLGTSKGTLRDKWFVEYPELKEAFEQGREDERRTLHNKLYRAATEGEGRDALIAAMFLLKSRHGYREGEPVEDGARTHITFNLPAAMPLEQFMTIEHGPTTQRLPDAPAVPARRG